MGHPIHSGKLLPMEDKPVLEPKALPAQWETLSCFIGRG
jgi:hypothetical protein